MKTITLVVYLVAFAMLAQLSALASFPQDDHSCWGSDKPCSDGKYRDHRGKEQPATCDNASTSEHPCQCSRTTTKVEECPSSNLEMDMSKCSVYCREEACKCVTVCDFNDQEKK